MRRYEVLYVDQNGRLDRSGPDTSIGEFREKDIPPEFRGFCKLRFALRWLGAVHAAEHDVRAAARLIGEDPALMRRFNHTFTGWLGKVSQLYPREVQEAYEKLAKKTDKKK